jgi:protein arginine N-methyltransferase 1
VEASGIADIAKMVFEANHVEDRITLIEGWSTQVDLPERADVLVTEIIDDEPFSERILEIILDARKRLLKPGARLVPGKVEAWAIPVTVPSDSLSEYIFTQGDLANWRSWYEIDFDPLASISHERPASFYVRPVDARGWKYLSPPVLLARVDLAAFTHTSMAVEAVGIATAGGELEGLMIFSEVELSSENRLSTHPGRASENSNWRNRVHILPKPFSVKPGDSFGVRYRYRASGDGCDVKVEPNGR